MVYGNFRNVLLLHSSFNDDPKKPYKSETNFTREFFFDNDEQFHSVTKKFNNPGYKIDSGPMEVEFMLQVR